MYLITGLSLVMCNFELVIKFRIHELQQLATQASKDQVKKQYLALNAIHWILGILMISILLWFLIWISFCFINDS